MASSVKEQVGYIGCDYYSWNIDNLEIAHRSKATASAKPNNTFLPGNIVIVCASSKQGLFAFLAEAKYVYPDRTAKDIWPAFHRPDHLVTALKVLSPIKQVPDFVHGRLGRSGISKAHREQVVDFLRGHAIEIPTALPETIEIKKQPVVTQQVPSPPPASKPIVVKPPVIKPEPSYGFVYLLKEQQGGYKIGITDNVKRRFKQLEVGTKSDCIGYWSSKDYKEIENHLHMMFDRERVPQSEWFHLSEVQMAFVCQWLDDHATRIPIVEPVIKTVPKFNQVIIWFLAAFTLLSVGGYIGNLEREQSPQPSYSYSAE